MIADCGQPDTPALHLQMPTAKINNFGCDRDAEEKSRKRAK